MTAIFQDGDMPYLLDAMAVASNKQLNLVDRYVGTSTRRRGVTRRRRAEVIMNALRADHAFDRKALDVLNILFVKFGNERNQAFQAFEELRTKVLVPRGVQFSIKRSFYHPEIQQEDELALQEMIDDKARADALERLRRTPAASQATPASSAARKESTARASEEDAVVEQATTSGGRAKGQSQPPEVEDSLAKDGERIRSRMVFVVHGQDLRPVKALRTYLHFLGLRIISWSQARDELGVSTPATFDIVRKGIEMAGAVIVIFSPDEHVELRAELSPKMKGGVQQPSQQGYQARPNVFLEAGLAYAANPQRTIFVQSSNSMRSVSDIVGFNNIRMDGSNDQRKALMNALQRLRMSVEPADDNLLDDLAGPFRVDEWE